MRRASGMQTYWPVKISIFLQRYISSRLKLNISNAFATHFTMIERNMTWGHRDDWAGQITFRFWHRCGEYLLFHFSFTRNYNYHFAISLDVPCVKSRSMYLLYVLGSKQNDATSNITYCISVNSTFLRLPNFIYVILESFKKFDGISSCFWLNLFY